jgi:hypothetical protein
MENLTSLPHDFGSIVRSPPEGFVISERVLEPILVVERVLGKLAVTLGGKKVFRNEAIFPKAPTIKHAWVVDNLTLRPIPADVPVLVSVILGEEDASDISYALAIRLYRYPPEGLAVQLAADVLHSGKIAAEELSAEISIPGLVAEMFPYQARGVQWMWKTISRTGG